MELEGEIMAVFKSLLSLTSFPAEVGMYLSRGVPPRPLTLFFKIKLVHFYLDTSFNNLIHFVLHSEF